LGEKIAAIEVSTVANLVCAVKLLLVELDCTLAPTYNVVRFDCPNTTDSPNENVNGMELLTKGEVVRVANKVVMYPFEIVCAAVSVGVPPRIRVEEGSVARYPLNTGTLLALRKDSPFGRGGNHVYTTLLPRFGYGGQRDVTTRFEMGDATTIDNTLDDPEISIVSRSPATRMLISTVTI
jgi:hypothetical protein